MTQPCLLNSMLQSCAEQLFSNCSSKTTLSEKLYCHKFTSYYYNCMALLKLANREVYPFIPMKCDIPPRNLPVPSLLNKVPCCTFCRFTTTIPSNNHIVHSLKKQQMLSNITSIPSSPRQKGTNTRKVDNLRLKEHPWGVNL